MAAVTVSLLYFCVNWSEVMEWGVGSTLREHLLWKAVVKHDRAWSPHGRVTLVLGVARES